MRRGEHIPKWIKTANSRPKSKKAPQSAATRHLTECDKKVDVLADEEQGFRVLKSLKTRFQLAVAESVMIKQSRPSLCLQKDRLYLLKLF